MFEYFTLEQVYEYAERLGYEREDVEVEQYCSEYDYDLDQEVAWEYQVSFGHMYVEAWVWTFEDLEAQATDYEHIVWED